MPERFVDEETQTRTQSLCLFGDQEITFTSNRCENCPGAAGRLPQLHQKRCPLDIRNESKQVAAEKAGKSKVADPKTLLASSSSSSSSKAEQHVTENVVVTTTSDEIQNDSLDESSRPSGRRLAALQNSPSPTTDRCVLDPHSVVIGRKRKADDWPESSSRNELLADPPGEDCSPKKLYRAESVVRGLLSLSIGDDDERPGRDISLDTAVRAPALISLNHPEGSLPRTEVAVLADFTPEVNERARLSGDELDGSDVREFLRNKKQIIFQDRPDDEPAPMMVWGINATSNASFSSLFSTPTTTREEYASASPSPLVSSFGICIPGIGMLSAQRGVPSGSDGIFNVNDPEEHGLMSAMEIVGPSDEDSLIME